MSTKVRIMQASDVYVLAGTAIFIPWIMLMFLPFGRFTMWVAQISAVILLLLGAFFVYKYFFVSGRAGEIFSLDGMSKLMSNEYMVVAAWLNYLSFCLFGGLWLVNDGHDLKIPHIFLLLPLFLTFLAGPFGVVAYLLMRYFKTGKWVVK